MKYLRIHNVSIYINFYKNLFINECVSKSFPVKTKRRNWWWYVEELTFLMNLKVVARWYEICNCFREKKFYSRGTLISVRILRLATFPTLLLWLAEIFELRKGILFELVIREGGFERHSL